MKFSRLLSANLVLLLVLSLAPSAAAAPQKINGKYRQFPNLGLEFRNIKDMSDVPINDNLKGTGLVAQGTADEGPLVKAQNGERFNYQPSLFVYYDDPQGPMTGEGGGGEKAKKRRTPADFLNQAFGLDVSKSDPVEEEEFKSTKKVEGMFTRYQSVVRTNRGAVDVYLDVYVFFDQQARMVFLWNYPCGDKKHIKKWGSTVEKSMKSLRYMKKGADESEMGDVNSESSYEDLLEYHRREVKQTPGWDLIEAPSEDYLIKTNSKDRKDIKTVIKRLEASRRLFEEDFPPHAPITSISVVRICNTREEFSTYGQTRPGVAGYFNPGSEELVLFFEEGALEETLGVMTHEAFHQYCHFLFNRSAAHRWFDEGHGDYYGAWILKGKNLKPGKDMEGGLSRLPHLHEMLENDQLAPLSEHIRADHPTWQNQGPRNISNYCQSFGLIYYLREGTRKKVKKRYWKAEYAEIIPNYMKSLYEGFDKAYKEVAESAREDLASVEEKLEDPDLPKDLRKNLEEQAERMREAIARPWDGIRMTPDFRERRDAIWDKAMADSWGKIDEAEFEKTWLKYVEKEL